MTHDQLLGKYARLQEELASAYADARRAGVPADRAGRIDRIADDLADIERCLAHQPESPRATRASKSLPARPNA